MPAKKKDAFNFENSLKELNQLVDNMEQGNLSLENSLAQFETGIKLIRNCQSALTAAEQKVKILTQADSGDELIDFNTND
ncbi:MAG: exodeoxyribonuclease VII small subunit [Coxiella sp. (in: Bacteria)]|nr:MAG: exodeoxyribonuclease VII small subunit [Coxiella sp. (in: g-proteobacteria)]